MALRVSSFIVILGLAAALGAARTSAQSFGRGSYGADPAQSITLPPDVFGAPTFVPVSAMPAARVMLGTFPIVLEVTKLSAVQAKIGVGTIQIARGGDWDGEILLCYTLIRPDGGTRIWLSSNSDYGAALSIDGSRVIGIVATALPGTITVPSDCPILPQRFQPVSLNSGVFVGMIAADAIRRLAPKAKLDGTELRFDYDEPVKAGDRAAQKPNKAVKDYRVGSNLTVKIVDGKIAALSAQRTTTD